MIAVDRTTNERTSPPPIIFVAGNNGRQAGMRWEKKCTAMLGRYIEGGRNGSSSSVVCSSVSRINSRSNGGALQHKTDVETLLVLILRVVLSRGVSSVLRIYEWSFVKVVGQSIVMMM